METDGDEDGGSDTYREIYGVQFLDDIHNYFPAILYNHQRFRTIRDLLDYVRSRAEELNGYQFHESQAEWVRRRQGQERSSQGRSSINARRRPREEEEDIQVDVHRPSFLENIFRPSQSVVPLSSIIMPRNRLLPPHIADSFMSLNASLFGPRRGAASPYGFSPAADLITGLAAGLTTSLTPPIPPNFFDPVPIVPSLEQIEAASVCLIADISAADQVCSICQENYRVGDEQRCLRHCAHIFHKICVDRWFGSNVRCPLCRHDIREVAAGAGADADAELGLETSHVLPQTRTQVWYRRDWGGEPADHHASTILYSMRYDNDDDDNSYSESDGSIS